MGPQNFCVGQENYLGQKIFSLRLVPFPCVVSNPYMYFFFPDIRLFELICSFHTQIGVGLKLSRDINPDQSSFYE